MEETPYGLKTPKSEFLPKMNPDSGLGLFDHHSSLYFHRTVPMHNPGNILDDMREQLNRESSRNQRLGERHRALESETEEMRSSIQVAEAAINSALQRLNRTDFEHYESFWSPFMLFLFACTILFLVLVLLYLILSR